jgi:hypothetical protein
MGGYDDDRTRSMLVATMNGEAKDVPLVIKRALSALARETDVDRMDIAEATAVIVKKSEEDHQSILKIVTGIRQLLTALTLLIVGAFASAAASGLLN